MLSHAGCWCFCRPWCPPQPTRLCPALPEQQGEKVSSPHPGLTLAAPGLFKCLCSCTGGVLSPGQFCLGLEHSLTLRDGAAQGGDCITGQSCCVVFPSDQWDDPAGTSLAPGAQDDPGSCCSVSSEVLGCPTSFYLGRCWSQVHSSPLSADLLHSLCGAQRLPKPFGIQSLPSLLGSGGSLAPLLLHAGLGHHQFSLCCCPHMATSYSQILSSLLHCQGKDFMFLLLLQIMKLRFNYFFLIGFWAVIK